jgi:hypothetical protein
MIPIKVPDWLSSVRGTITLMIVFTFCRMAWTGKVEPKDFMLIVSLVMNFYFLTKKDEVQK